MAETRRKRQPREEHVSSYKVLVGGSIAQEKGTDRYDLNGFVATPFGYVHAGSWDYRTPESPDAGRGYYLHFIWKGRTYALWNNWKVLTKRGLVTVAGRFARDVVEGMHG